MIRDAIGNQLREGSLILWKDHDLVYKVVRIVDPNEQRVKVIGSEPPQPAIAIMATIPLQMEKNKDLVLPQFFCLVDPAQQEAIEGLLGDIAGSRKQ